VAGLGESLNVIQILWLNLVIATVPALVLAIEPADDEEMRRHARHETEPLTQAHLFLMGFWAVLMMLAGIGGYFLVTLAMHQPAAVGATAAFCTMGMVMTFNLFNVQALSAGESRGNFLAELGSTPITWIVVGVGLLLQAVTSYVPLLNTVMGTVPMPWIVVPVPIVLGLGAIMFSLKTMKV
jgi:Ca2+-transporting ATPase